MTIVNIHIIHLVDVNNNLTLILIRILRNSIHRTDSLCQTSTIARRYGYKTDYDMVENYIFASISKGQCYQISLYLIIWQSCIWVLVKFELKCIPDIVTCTK